MHAIIASEEQREIINCFKSGFNLKIEALAGCAKSTTLLMLVQEAKNWNVKSLLLTYNKDLKDELREKINESNLTGYCDAYTYHGYASKIYQQNIYNDLLLRNALTREPSIKCNYNIVLLDEVQDMNPDYHKLTTKILNHGTILVLVGDRRQCINEYLNATSEYLINYNQYFNTGRPWKELSLRTSYRLTPLLARFVNQNILGQDLIIPGNKTNKNILPIYKYGAWDFNYIVEKCVKKYGSDEVVIMTPSVRNINPKSPLGKLCSSKINGLMFCVKDNDLDSQTMKGKILITSYNSMKGRERKCTILLGFDESYFEYYDRKWNNNKEIPNVLYVAATRARELLVIIQDKNKAPLRTFKNIHKSCYIMGDNENKTEPGSKPNKKEFQVTDLIRHRNTTEIANLLQLLNIEIIKLGGNPLPYQNVIQFGGYAEDMRNYYGTVIPLIAQFKMTGKVRLTPYLVKNFDDDEPNLQQVDDIIPQYNNLLAKSNKTTQEWMKLAVLYTAINNNCYFYAYQITNYDWVDVNFINIQVQLIIDSIPKNGVFEQPIEKIIKGYKIQGCIDYNGEDEIWEFKCSSSLTDEYKIQLGAYLSMIDNVKSNIVKLGKLFNTRTGEILSISVNDKQKYLDIFLQGKTSFDETTIIN